ncbi:hypothetical protein [Paenibacillus polymyxa]|uniref:Uncharacterized protein n=1 Tax=Paenibacillus polymyxa TaxID=1406 RepID=A0A378Y062_PAEPO|nr:hypothetical protein [Paenibacillus polymyxa]MBE7896126.1 hypothetical protein [Paenibacillus polymyxa]MBG9765928.1 hypothetical protein [Paenibacillus polymyxa]MCC3256656.1 hypothetical protein [Paenibacillus polymyxa]UOD84466.1 hypothetical protein CUU60_04335 [Paenibacillus polymyxa ATCC 842]WEK65571.1 hypothetical protein ERJ71_14755 [Paenibacillus polymyxa]
MDFNQWYLQNSSLVGFINILLTVLLTALNVWFARNSQRYSADTVRQNEEIRKENNTPNIIAYFNSVNLRNVYFHLSNIGNIPAKDIKIKLKPKNRSVVSTHIDKAHMIKEGVAFLAPGQSLTAFVEGFIQLMDDDKNFPSFYIEINYRDIDNNCYSRSYELDLNMYAGYVNSVPRDIKDVYEEMKKIEKHIGKISDNYKKEIRKKDKMIEKHNSIQRTRIRRGRRR